MSLSANTVHKQRIQILQTQINEAKQSKETHNFMGVSVADQIKEWEKLIKQTSKKIK